jgi:hypothetical protein
MCPSCGGKCVLLVVENVLFSGGKRALFLVENAPFFL